jgi:pimeloyl-ACP methyl ester carboxylesterase
VRIGLILEQTSDGALAGTLVRPDHADRFEMDDVEWRNDRLHLRIDAIEAEYVAALDEAGDLDGRWTQRDRNMPLRLRRVDEITAPERPQTPAPPFPYDRENVFFESRARGITLGGTLTLPRGGVRSDSTRSPKMSRALPAAILVPGVGAHGRDYVVRGHRRFLVLADHLTRRGFAVLRFDERGVGASTGTHEGAASPDLALDALGGVDFLRNRSGIDPRRVGIIGHSEGGTIALLAAARDSAVAFVVALAAPGLAGRDYSLQYEASVWKSMGLEAATIAAKRETQEQILDVVAGGVDSTQARVALARILSELRPPVLEGKREAALERFLSPWFRFSVRYDPARTLTKVDCPVLAVFGEKDVQVPPAGNREAMQAAMEGMPPAARRGSAVVVLPGLNHFLQTAKTGSPTEYGTIEETLDPAAMERIAAWMETRVAGDGPSPGPGRR